MQTDTVRLNNSNNITDSNNKTDSNTSLSNSDCVAALHYGIVLKIDIIPSQRHCKTELQGILAKHVCVSVIIE